MLTKYDCLPIEDIYIAYTKRGESLNSLGKQYGCNATIIKRKLKRFDPDVSIRSKDDIQRPSVLNNPDYLKQINSLYVTSKELKVRADVVITAFRRFNISNPKNMILPDDINLVLTKKKTIGALDLARLFGVTLDFIIDFYKSKGWAYKIFVSSKPKRRRKKKKGKSDWGKISYTNKRVDDFDNLTDLDIFFHLDWSGIFHTAEKCYLWLKDYQFCPIKYPSWELNHGLKFCEKYSKIIKDTQPSDILDGFKWLNANIYAPTTVALITHFSPHYWKSSHTDYQPPSVCWEIGNFTVLKNACIKLWNTKTKSGNDRVRNIYSLMSTIEKNYKDFTKVSIFKPWVASTIYQKLIPNGGTVIDPCMGWGGRLLGCIGHDINYHGFDLNPCAVKANKELVGFIGAHINQATFVAADASSYKYPRGDLLFTSPPYDNTEYYHGLKTQCSDTNPIYHNIFKSNVKIIALNIPKRHSKICIDIGKNYGWSLAEEMKMTTKHFKGERITTYEPILIFRKKNRV